MQVHPGPVYFFRVITRFQLLTDIPPSPVEGRSSRGSTLPLSILFGEHNAALFIPGRRFLAPPLGVGYLKPLPRGPPEKTHFLTLDEKTGPAELIFFPLSLNISSPPLHSTGSEDYPRRLVTLRTRSRGRSVSLSPPIL